jgi:UDP-glucose 4-epimerase
VKGNYQRLVHALARRRFVPVGAGDNRRTLVFQDDLSAAIAIAAIHPLAAGRVYNVTDGATHPMREIIASICAALGRSAPRFHAPVAPIRAVLTALRVLDGRWVRALDTYLDDVAIDGGRMKNELGFRPQATLEQGWMRTIAEMRRSSLL